MILYFLEFVAFVFLILYPWGTIFLREKENIFIKINFGIVASVVVYFLLAFLKLKFLIFPVLFVPLVYLILTRKINVPKIKLDWTVSLVVIFVVLIQSLINVTSGDLINGGLRLIGAHQNDSLWAIALAQSIERGIPPLNLGFPQAFVQNYHYFFNIFMALVHGVSKIPALTLYLKIISPFLLLLFSTTTYIFIYKLTKSRWAGVAAAVLTGVTSNLYYLAGVFFPQASVSPSVLWANEYETHIVNPPLLISYSIVLTILYLLLQKKKQLLPMALLAGTLIAFKSFAATLLVPSLGVLALIDLFKKKYFYLKLTIISGVIALITYFAVNPSLGSIIILQPLYLIESMMAAGDRLNFPVWALKIQTYAAEANSKRIIQLYLEGILVFLIGNLGLRLLGLGAIFINKLDTEAKKVVTFLLTLSVLGTISSLLFVFRGIAWNSVQFFYYTVFSLSLLTVIFLHHISEKFKALAIFLFLITWISLIPGVFFINKSYLNGLSTTTDPGLTQGAMFLAGQPEGIVLVNPKYEATSFIPAVSGQETLITNPGILDMQLINHQRQSEEIEAFFGAETVDLKFLSQNNIKYIFTNTEDLPRYDQRVTPLIYTWGNIAILRSDNPSPH